MCTSSFGNAVIPITIITILTPPAYCTHQEAWLDILSTTHTSHPCWLSSFLVTLLSDILNHDKVHDHLENCTNYLGKPALSSSVHSHTAEILEISNYLHIIDGVLTPNTNHPYGHDHCKFKNTYTILLHNDQFISNVKIHFINLSVCKKMYFRQ